MSILSNLSKFTKKIKDQQLYDCFHSILSPKQGSFRGGHSALHGFMVMPEQLKESKDRENKFGLYSLTFLKHLIV